MWRMKTFKQIIKKRFSIIVSWRSMFLQLKHKYINPRQRNRYKYCAPSAILEMPFDISNYSGISIGPYVKIRKGFTFLGNSGVFSIKKYATIAMNCIVVTDGHLPTVGLPQILTGTNHINDRVTNIIVHEGAWIGANCILLPGTEIGRGAIIGAGSIVTKSIPPYAVAAGNPAKIIATAFTIDEIIDHEKALYPRDERLSQTEIETIFIQFFKGKKSIGINSIPEKQKAKMDMSLRKIRNDIERI